MPKKKPRREPLIASLSRAMSEDPDFKEACKLILEKIERVRKNKESLRNVFDFHELFILLIIDYLMCTRELDTVCKGNATRREEEKTKSPSLSLGERIEKLEKKLKNIEGKR